MLKMLNSYFVIAKWLKKDSINEDAMNTTHQDCELSEIYQICLWISNKPLVILNQVFQ